MVYKNEMSSCESIVFAEFESWMLGTQTRNLVTGLSHPEAFPFPEEPLHAFPAATSGCRNSIHWSCYQAPLCSQSWSTVLWRNQVCQRAGKGWGGSPVWHREEKIIAEIVLTKNEYTSLRFSISRFFLSFSALPRRKALEVWSHTVRSWRGLGWVL